MPSEPSLARLFRDHGQRWEIEKIARGNEWVAVRRDDDGTFHILSAHDLGALRYHIEAAERESAEAAMTSDPDVSEP